MPKFKNVSPLGALDLALVGRVIEPGEVFEVTDAQAERLEGQTATWKPIRAAGRKPADSDTDPATDTDSDATEGDTK